MFSRIFYRKIYKLHVYLGVFVALHFVVLSVTGLILLFKDELQGSPTAAEHSSNLSPQQVAHRYDQILTNIAQTYPDDRPLALFPDELDPMTIHARIGIDGATKLRGARRTMFHLDSGAELNAPTTNASNFFDFMLEIHRDFLMGSNGKLYVGFVGLLYVTMLISGFYLYGTFMKGRRLGSIRNARVPKLVDLHKFTGVITFGWSLIVGMSGVFLAFNGILIKFFQYKSLKHLATQYEHFSATTLTTAAPIEEVVSAALQAKPESYISYVSFPDTEFGIPGHYLLLMNGTTPITERISELLVINAHTAVVSELVELPLYLKAVLLSEPLHFGDYGGLLLKLIWGLFTLASLGVVILGLSTFVIKRRRRTRGTSPQPRRPQSPMATKHRKPFFSKTNAPLTIPSLLAALTCTALVTALFASGVIAQVAIASLLIPIILILIGRSKS